MSTRNIKRLGVIIIAAIAITTALFINHHKPAKWVAVKKGPVITAVYGLGTVTSDHIYALRSGVTNNLSQVYVHEGEAVKEGQALVKYHDGQLVTAPFNGMITDLPAHDHEVVDQQTPILTLTDLNNRYILVSLDQDSAIAVKPNMPVKVNFETLDGPAFSGHVQSIYPNGSNFYVRIHINHLPLNILPEMTGDVAIITNKINNALQVPLKAITNNKLTYRLNQTKKTITVKVGAHNGDWAQIISNNLPEAASVRVG